MLMYWDIVNSSPNVPWETMRGIKVDTLFVINKSISFLIFYNFRIKYILFNSKEISFYTYFIN